MDYISITDTAESVTVQVSGRAIRYELYCTTASLKLAAVGAIPLRSTAAHKSCVLVPSGPVPYWRRLDAGHPVEPGHSYTKGQITEAIMARLGA